MDQQLKRAVAVHDELRDWCNSFTEGTMPCPSVTLAGDYVDLSIGELTVWDSESGYADEMNDDYEESPSVDRCISTYQRLVEMMSAWPNKK